MTAPDIRGAVLALDQAMIALAVAKSVLLGDTSEPVDLAAAEASPANPYGAVRDLPPDAPHPMSPEFDEWERGRYDAASAAEVAEGVEPEGIELCGAREHAGWMCIRADGHEGPHEADGPTMANPLITWEDPSPFPHVPHLPQHTNGSPVCNLCGMDHDAAARLAPPAGYQLRPVEVPADGA